MPLVENLSVFFADMGLLCVANGVSFLGLLDQPDETLNASGINVLSTMYQLTVRSSDVQLASVKSGTAVNVGGFDYVTRDVLLIDDGELTHLTLTKI